MKKLFIKTYGCQMNFYDSDKMASLLKPHGYSITETPEEADMMILNTCHIREKAEQKVFSDLGRLRPVKEEREKQGKETLLAVAGCVAQAEGGEIIRQAPYVDMVFGPQTYHRLPEMLAQARRHNEKAQQQKDKGLKPPRNVGIVDVDFPEEAKFDHLNLPTEVSHNSAFLTVQEGCDKFCTFCCVPYTRGSEFSRPVKDVLTEAKHLISLGVKEITLLGQNVNAYHGESPNSSSQEWGLGKLVQELALLEGLERIRYTTSHPNDVDEELIHAHATVPQLMPFLHLPVQSGHDAILDRMNRRHTVKTYLQVIEKLRHAREDMAFSSDFIVGFPGETDAHFKGTLDLVKEVGYAQAYSFAYSPRHGTPASIYDEQVPEAVKKERLHLLQALLQDQQITFNKTFIGKTTRILLEKEGRHEEQLIGRSPYMQSVVVSASSRLKGTFVDVMVHDAHLNSLSGKIITSEGILLAS